MNPTISVNHTLDTDQSERETPSAILAGMLPFVLFGLMYVLKGVNYHASLAWLGRGSFEDRYVFALMLIGLGIGWAKRFPRWTYAYLGVMLMFSVWLANSVTTVWLYFWPGILGLAGLDTAAGADCCHAVVNQIGTAVTPVVRGHVARLDAALFCSIRRSHLANYGRLLR